MRSVKPFTHSRTLLCRVPCVWCGCAWTPRRHATCSGNRAPDSRLGTMVSADGVHWTDYTPADAMKVAADTANNLLYDPTLKQYIAYSRIHCTAQESCNYTEWGERRETRSTVADITSGDWTPGVQVLHGESGYDACVWMWHHTSTLTPSITLTPCMHPCAPACGHGHDNAFTSVSDTAMYVVVVVRGWVGAGTKVTHSCRGGHRNGRLACTWPLDPFMPPPIRKDTCTVSCAGPRTMVRRGSVWHRTRYAIYKIHLGLVGVWTKGLSMHGSYHMPRAVYTVSTLQGLTAEC